MDWKAAEEFATRMLADTTTGQVNTHNLKYDTLSSCTAVSKPHELMGTRQNFADIHHPRSVTDAFIAPQCPQTAAGEPQTPAVTKPTEQGMTNCGT